MTPNIRSSILGRGAAALGAAALGLTMVACTPDSGDPAATPPPATMPGDPAETPQATDPASPESTAQRDIVTDPPANNWQDALTAAREGFEGDPSRIQLERQDDGTLQYEIDLVSDTEKYEVELDAETLDVLSADRGELGADAASEREQRFNPDELQTTLDSAVEVARGEQEGSINTWVIEGDSEEGQPVVHYEFDFDSDGLGDNTVRVDAATGGIVQD